MFSVPGWTISAPLATQTEDPNAKKNAPEGKKKQKKKQKNNDVTEENVEHMYAKAVEKRDVSSKLNGAAAGAETQTGTEAASEETRGKKRKRGNRKKIEKTETDNAAAVEDNGTRDKATDAAEASAIAPAPAEPVSNRQKKKQKKEHKTDGKPDTPKLPDATAGPVDTSSLLPEPKGLTPLQKSMRQKLLGARFRWLNETLYTKPSAESLSLIKDNPEFFEEYHRGFQQQVEVWPENPVDGYVSAILARGKVRYRDAWKDKKRRDKKGPQTGEEPQLDETSEKLTVKALPRNMKGHCTIADLGCGTAALSYALQPHLRALNLTIHSFDLSKPTGPSGPLVTIADISALPLASGTADIAIFCLALMGTNWLDFIDEAYRILRWKGELWVAEIKSRFGRVSNKKKPPINSIGSLDKRTMSAANSKAKKEAAAKKNKYKQGKDKDKPLPEGPQDSDDEELLATHVDGVEGAKNETDVSAFVEVLRKRGFVLDNEAGDKAVDLGNKMFVRMQFVKAAHPSKGKNAVDEGAKSAGKGKGNGNGVGKRFVKLGDEEQGDEMDGRVLKPCLYKIR